MSTKVMYAGEIRYLEYKKEQIPCVILYSKESRGYVVIKYFDLKNMKLCATCLELTSNEYSKESYPLYKFDNFKLADLLYNTQMSDKIQTSSFYKVRNFMVVSPSLLEEYVGIVPNIESSVEDVKIKFEKIENQYENTLKQIANNLMDSLLKEDLLAPLHTHFYKV